METLKEKIGDSTVLFGEKSAEATNISKDEIIVCALSPGRASLKPVIHKMAVLSRTVAHRGGCPTEVESQTLAYNKGKPAIMGCLRSGGDLISF